MGDPFGIVTANRAPSQAGLECDCCGNCQPWADIARPLEFVEAQARRRAELIALVKAAAIGMPAPANLQRRQAVLVAAHQVQKTRPRRRQQPFVAIRAVEIRADLVEIHGNHGRRVRAIHNCKHAALAGFGAQLAGRQHHPGRRQDMAEEQKPRTRCQGCSTGVDHLLRFVSEDRQRKCANRQSHPLGRMLPAPVHRAVFVVRH